MRRTLASGNIGFIFVLLATVIAYSPILFDWFTGDDMAHVDWLHRAAADHSLIWRNFYANWLDSVGTLFYRPLISVSIYLDYLLWHENGLGFHVTNLLLHICAGTCLFFLLRHIVRRHLSVELQSSVFLAAFPSVAAGIFLLYPLHAEAVSWMIGRVDVVVTAFFMAALLCYAKSRDSVAWQWTGFALVFMALSLMSKEMGIVLPAVLVVYEWFFGDCYSQKAKDESVAAYFIGCLRRSFVFTYPYWLLLAGYFCLRRYALGTFLGGYDDSFGLVTGLDVWFRQIGQGLWFLAVPFNQAVFSVHNTVVRAWELLSVIALTSFALTIFQPRLRSFSFFAFSFLLISLVPVYKIFAINGVLGNSRLAYLATIPFSCLLAWGLCSLGTLVDRVESAHTCARSFPNVLKALNVVAAPAVIWGTIGSFLLLAAVGLYKNNQPWAEAGRSLNSVRTAITKLPLDQFRETKTRLIFYGLPEFYKGAYICRNAFDFLIDRHIRVTRLMESENCFSFGSLKAEIDAQPNKFRIFRWNREQKDLETMTPNRAFSPLDRKWTVCDVMPGLAEIPVSYAENLKWDNNSLVVGPSNQERVFQVKLPAVPAWNCDFLILGIEVKPAPGMLKDMWLDIPGKASWRRVHGALANLPVSFESNSHSATRQNVIFSLRSLPELAFDQSTVPELNLHLPQGFAGVLHSVHVSSAEKLMPSARFDAFTNPEIAEGYAIISPRPREDVAVMKVDASNVDGAHGVAVEISKNLIFFTESNPAVFQTCSKTRKSSQLSASFPIARRDLADGRYDVRAWALDDRGNPIGVASDNCKLLVWQ